MELKISKLIKNEELNNYVNEKNQTTNINLSLRFDFEF